MARAGEPQTLTLWIDGSCSFCSRLGRWLQRRARQRGHVLHLAALPEGAEAVVVECAGRRIEGAEALQCVLHYLGGSFRIGAWLLAVMPEPIRRWCYRWVARHRYWLFGRSVCGVENGNGTQG